MTASSSHLEHINIASRFLDSGLQRGYADRPAVYFEDEVYSHGALCELSWRVSNVLRTIGVQSEQRVLLIMKDSPLFLAAWFATLRVGGVTSEAYAYLPVREMRTYVSALRPTAIVADETTIEKVRSAVDDLPYPEHMLVSGLTKSRLKGDELHLDTLVDEMPAECSAQPTTRDQSAYCLFSGGTTGAVKVVVHRHFAAEVLYENLQGLIGYDEDDLVLPVPKLFFGYSRLYGPLCALRAGAACIIYPERATATRIIELIRRHRPTVLINVPTMMRRLVELRGVSREDLATVRVAISSGEHLGADLYLRWHQAFGVEAVNVLSTTEVGGVPCLANLPGEQVPGSVGRPRPGVEAKLVDPETGESVTDTGVLMLRTEGAGVCYWENYDQTRKTFREDGWISHNDLFRRDAGGNYWFAGRSDDLVKVSGTFVSPTEIEACLERHPDVAETTVVAVEDKAGLVTTVAFVVVRSELDPVPELEGTLQQYVKSELAPTKYPRHVRFLPELPKTPQGKINRRRLSALTKEALT